MAMTQEDDLEQIVKEHQEDLQILAKSDLRSAKYAQRILKSYGMDYPQEHNDRQETSIEGKSDTNTEGRKSLLSF